MSGNPVEYAEKTLGVHVPWTEAVDAQQMHEQIRAGVAEYRNRVRDAQHAYDEAVREATTEATGAYVATVEKPTAAGQDRFVKDAVATDDNVRITQSSLIEYRKDLELMEGQLDSTERKLSLLTARLTELGGLLTFYAMRSPAPTK